MTETENDQAGPRMGLEALLLLYLLIGPNEDEARRAIEALRADYQLIGPWIDAA